MLRLQTYQSCKCVSLSVCMPACVAIWQLVHVLGLDGQQANPCKAAEQQRCMPFLTGTQRRTHTFNLSHALVSCQHLLSPFCLFYFMKVRLCLLFLEGGSLPVLVRALFVILDFSVTQNTISPQVEFVFFNFFESHHSSRHHYSTVMFCFLFF